MPIFTDHPPLSLYIHIPWCVRKCPYCDFNSHAAKGALPEQEYISRLLQDLDHYLPLIARRPLISLFFGGGTPSLFSGAAIAEILAGVAKRCALSPNIEITLEANPGTVEQQRFRDFREAGVNRLSLGIQSLQNDKLKTLGRIHDRDHALKAIEGAKNAGFDNFNLDLMHGLPHQSLSDALHDLETALAYEPTHLSWYQLTIEPNTLFYHQTPPLPPDETLEEMQIAGQQLLQQTSFQQYEVSAYARGEQNESKHNRNYWEFGDYLGIGAGAHSKITDLSTGTVLRYAEIKHPKAYLDPKKPAAVMRPVTEKELIFEFMLNALRLTQGIRTTLFTERTGLTLDIIHPILNKATQQGLLMTDDPSRIQPSELGRRFLNDLVGMFLGED